MERFEDANDRQCNKAVSATRKLDGPIIGPFNFLVALTAVPFSYLTLNSVVSPGDDPVGSQRCEMLGRKIERPRYVGES